MKKIAIASCYAQHNYGSMLQAYATQKILDILGIDNETIDTTGINKEIQKKKNKYFLKAAFTSDILLYKMGMVKSIVRRKFIQNDYARNMRQRNQMFDKFREKYKVSPSFSSREELSNYCSSNYSAVIVGSDQLWLPGNIAGDYYTLSFVPSDVNSIAYSTSFGQASLPKDMEDIAAAFLKRIRHISVREDSGQSLIYSLTGRKVPVVCDPTLLLTPEDWLEIQDEENKYPGPYIFCYFLGTNPKHRDFVTRLSKATGCRIVALTHVNEYVKCDEQYADETPYDVGPGEFVKLIRYARYVCTDSFHCTVFAMLYKRRFFTLKRYGNTKQSTNNRLETLFRLVGLNEQFFNGDEDIEYLLNKEIDFVQVEQNIEKIREQSLQYLKAAIADEGSTDL